jgi:hypothetical protein
MGKKILFAEGQGRDRFYNNVRRAVELLKTLNPEQCRDMAECLTAMQEEYHDACAARDFHEREFERLMAAVMREKLKEGWKKDEQHTVKLVLNDGTGKMED